MSYPQHTFELRISFDPSNKSSRASKQDVLQWLPAHGIDEFVEGFMEGLDIDHEYTGPSDRDFYAELGGDLLPVSVYKYSRELLEDLQVKLSKDFGSKIVLEIIAMETSEWLEGWKESFKPIQTELFYIYPPWDDETKIPKNKIPILVEPGMAFGTGQHGTTQVCLRKLESLSLQKLPLQTWRLCDVGTGTGILAIGAKFLGFKSVVGTDIDPDAITAALNNAVMNKISIPFWQGSAPVLGVEGRPEFAPPFDVVVANILFVVLEKIVGNLAQITRPGGLLILSGILAEDADIMIGLATQEGLNLVGQGELEGWACLTFTPRPKP